MNNNSPYRVFYNNYTRRYIVQKNNNFVPPSKKIVNSNEFEKKLEELSKVERAPIDNTLNLKTYPSDNIQESINYEMKKYEKINYSKQNIIYGIKKTILSDFNYLYQSSNSNDFKIGINKSCNKNIFIFDSFYLFPNISEINTKNETNIINEKKVEVFNNRNEISDKQYFPIDFVPCGINVPLKSSNRSFRKIIIKNIYWNIFQSIDSNNYELDELLCIIPQKNNMCYAKISLNINFELHSQLSSNLFKKYSSKILPYKNSKITYTTPANSCLYKVVNVKINKLNGSYFQNIEIELLEELEIECALLCLRVSVPDESIEILKGNDKNNNISCGTIPFSQFILNFDYELI